MDARFRPRGVEVVDVQNDVCFEDGSLSSPGASEPRFCHEGQL